MTISENNRTAGIYLILILSTVIAYWGVSNNDFISYDDHAYVSENTHVLQGLNGKNIVWAFTTGSQGNWHPLTWISHMLDCELFGAEPVGHHLINLLLHLVNTLLLFELMRRMTRALWPSAFVAVAFALHPMHVESVAWVAERKDVLSGLFWMLTIAAYLRYVKSPSVSRYLPVLIAFALGLMAKPMLVTLPFVLLLLDYWPLERFQRSAPGTSSTKQFQKKRVLGLMKEKIPLFLCCIASSVITFFVQQKAGAMLFTETGTAPLATRLANALVSYIVYMGKMVCPINLAVLYPYPADGSPLWQPITAFAVLVVISLIVLRLAKRKPYLLVGWLWYVGTMVPVIGLIQVGFQAFADRYTYLPYIGLFIIVAWSADDICAGWKKRKIVLGILAATTLGGMFILTRTQVKYWKSSMTLYEHALDVTDNNFIMHYNMGLELAKINRMKEAEDHFRRTIEIKPDFGKAYNDLGNALWLQGQPEKAADLYRKTLEINPDHPLANYNLGILLEAQGKFDAAIVYLRKALSLAGDSGDGELRKQIETRLRSFRQRQPYVDE